MYQESDEENLFALFLFLWKNVVMSHKLFLMDEGGPS